MFVGVATFTNLNMGTLFNGENETYYREIIIADTTIGTDTVVQINRTLTTGMETDFSNVVYYDISGTLLEQDSTFDADDLTLRLKIDTSDTSTIVYERWGADITAVETSLFNTGNSLNYYIDQNNDVWIKETYPATSSTTYILKKEDGFTPTLGDNIFKFFDDFNDNSIDASKWNYNSIGGSSSVTETGGYVQVRVDEGGTNEQLAASLNTDDLFTYPFIIESTIAKNVYKDTSSGTRYLKLGTRSAYAINYNTRNELDKVGFAETFFVESNYINNGGVTTLGDSAYRLTEDVWYPLTLQFAVSDSYLKLNGETIIATESSLSASEGYISLYGHLWDAGCYGYARMDWIGVREYASTEPTVTVTDHTTYNEITVENTLDSELTDYQVKMLSTDIDTSTQSDSLNIATLSSITQYESTVGDTYYLINSDTTSVNTGSSAEFTKTFIDLYTHEWYVNGNITQNNTTTLNPSFTYTPETVGTYNITLYSYDNNTWLTEVNDWTLTCSTPVAPSSGGGGGGSSISIPTVVEEVNNEVIKTTDDIVIQDSEQLKDFDLLENDLTTLITLVVLLILIFLVAGLYRRK